CEAILQSAVLQTASTRASRPHLWRQPQFAQFERAAQKAFLLLYDFPYSILTYKIDRESKGRGQVGVIRSGSEQLIHYDLPSTCLFGPAPFPSFPKLFGHC